jgi:hypothetical protein
LNRRIASIETLREEIAAWQGPRNQLQTKIHWQFGTDLARTKLKRLYPPLESSENSVEPETPEPVKTSVSAHYGSARFSGQTLTGVFRQSLRRIRKWW